MTQPINRPKNVDADASLKNTPPPPLPFAKDIKKPAMKPSSMEKMTTKEALQVVKDLKKTHLDIENKLHELYEKTGWTPRQLQKYLTDHSNFTPEQLGQLEKEREALLKSFEMTDELEKQIKADLSGGGVRKEKSRKSKTAQVRRSWIPMK